MPPRPFPLQVPGMPLPAFAKGPCQAPFQSRSFKDSDVVEALAAIYSKYHIFQFNIVDLYAVSKRCIENTYKDILVQCRVEYTNGEKPENINIFCTRQNNHWHCMPLGKNP